MKYFILLSLFLYSMLLSAQTLITSYDTANRSARLELTSVTSEIGETFICPGSYRLTSAQFMIGNPGQINGKVFAQVYQIISLTGDSCIPTSVSYTASDTLDAINFPSNETLIDFHFNPDHSTLDSTGIYVITITFLAGNNGEKLSVLTDDSSPSYDGWTIFFQDPDWHHLPSNDLVFYLYGDPNFTTPPSNTNHNIFLWNQF